MCVCDTIKFEYFPDVPDFYDFVWDTDTTHV